MLPDGDGEGPLFAKERRVGVGVAGEAIIRAMGDYDRAGQPGRGEAVRCGAELIP